MAGQWRGRERGEDEVDGQSTAFHARILRTETAIGRHHRQMLLAILIAIHWHIRSTTQSISDTKRYYM